MATRLANSSLLRLDVMYIINYLTITNQVLLTLKLLNAKMSDRVLTTRPLLNRVFLHDLQFAINYSTISNRVLQTLKILNVV